VTDPAERRDRPEHAGVTVRRAGAADLDVLERLFASLNDMQRAMRAFEPRPALAAEARERYARLLHDDDAMVVVADHAGTAIGMGVGTVATPSTSSDERALLISNVIVLDPHRSAGVGRAITAELAAFARRKGLARAMIRTFAANEDALRFWSELGFEALAVDMVADTDTLLSASSQADSHDS
jgi:GNAT superfamily N-acetyltransferase